MAKDQPLTNEQLARAVERIYRCEEKITTTLLVAAERLRQLDSLINAPLIDDFLEGVRLEAAHQQERWGTDHDVGKSPEEWLWLVAYLCTKATQAARYGDVEKHRHHVITAGAALLNWHRHATGEMTAMRPGVDPASVHV
jgi:hypothetical protein